MRAPLIFLMALLCTDTMAKSLGVAGAVFPIGEKSFLTLITERLQDLEANGELEALQERWRETAAKQANRPTPLRLGRASQSSRHYWRAETTLNQDILGADGRVLYVRGTHVNALERLPGYQPCWLFFNADDNAQLLWAGEQASRCQNPKLILTGGSVRAAEKALQAVIYFDQGGRITGKLAITHVPAKVTREGNRLAIDEQAIGEGGHVL